MQPRLDTTGNSKPAQRFRRIRNPKLRSYGTGDGIDFVRCRICGKHRRLITGKHLSIHDTDRQAYLQEYRLSPDKLCSKSCRLNHSSRPDFCPHNKQEWIAAVKIVYQHGQVYAGFLQKHYPNLYREGFGYLRIGCGSACGGIRTRRYAAMGVLE